MKILFIGDIVSHLGRTTVASLLPKIKKSDSVDLVIANVENLAGGRGATQETVQEMIDSGVDYGTSGDHIFFLEEFCEEIESVPVLRPANYPEDVPGSGYAVIDTGKEKVLLINLLGSSVNASGASCPFRTADQILAELGSEVAATIIDFHAEGTSEKRALGFYLDGRVTAVLGTHTHVPTADAQILPQGTGYVTDVGMCGAKNSVLGVKTETIIDRFKSPYRKPFEWVRDGPAVFNAVLIETDKAGKTIKIERRDQEFASPKGT